MHAMWNAGDVPAPMIEIMSPAGFENFFHEPHPRFGQDRSPNRRPHQAAAQPRPAERVGQ
jgi:hypothetical protein